MPEELHAIKKMRHLPRQKSRYKAAGSKVIVRHQDLLNQEVRAGGAPETCSRRARSAEVMAAVSRDTDAHDGNGILSTRESELYLRRHTSHSDHVISELVHDSNKP